ncbi:aldo/keto reductase [Vannielia litorea]|uniref:Predicted oxidoreductase n=1 Tax=Vannielia litorea TaxID=1217970 RepID=A0A1N6GEY7_9RHOB|nr:aldo/keto reductase [Vannielia litorea]SIO06083.1 Predicted oxidoreductase [Vannielia litorea]
MKIQTLGKSDLKVPIWCLGTMTFGNQTPEAEGHAQIDAALDAGLCFLDTAEMYPVNPVRAETVGRTEEIIGNWVARSGRRGDVVIATKIVGPSQLVRDGRGITAETLREAVDNSLRRLQTDVIDLFQLHWPQRGSYHFRQHWGFAPEKQDRAATRANMEEVMAEMGRIRAAGKVRHFGTSNESAWGMIRWNQLASETGGPRMETVQNEYSLLCRMYDTDMAEMSHQEEVSLLAYSPLAAGLLTGKYVGGARPEGSRAAINGDLGGRITPRAEAATEAYVGLAARHGVDPVHMALAWAAERPFMGSVIFGATTLSQLAHIIAGMDFALTDELRKGIAEIHRAHPLPF